MSSDVVSNTGRYNRLLAHLLSAAIHHVAPESRLFAELNETDWRKIITKAHEQSITALVADRILCLPKEYRPPRSLAIELGVSIELIERGNKRLLQVLAETSREYTEAGLKHILLKGPTVAQYYPNPNLRASGDIDLYLPETGDYAKANEMARQKGYRLDGQSVYEQLYWRNKTAIENHLYVTYFGIPRYDKALERAIAPIRSGDQWGYTTIEGVSYRTIPLELNAVYIFLHILHHFSYMGIGWRQICDWILMLQSQSECMDTDLFARYTEEFDLLRPMGLFALMAVRHLGVGAEIFPFALPRGKRAEELADMIYEDVSRVGNFGMQEFAGQKFSNIWSRRWFMFRRTLVRSWRIGPISPEHIRPIPLIAIATRLRLLFR